ncbi:GNAT family N-acetyltransferase [Actinocorallia longicatena]|uniref:GNAT family N-acetyltransferase n=1 Tax=Actinocorallia longicatena TaxID=111803 RepID=UPI0031CEFEAB
MLREPTEDDLDAVRRWRNHPQVRAASFTTHEISAEEHRRWWTAVRSDPSRRVLVYEHRSVPSGVVTFSGLDGDAPEWGFWLDLDGLGDALMPAWIGLERAAVDHAFTVLAVPALHGEVLAGNAAVLALHRRTGFRESGRHIRRINGIDQEVVRLVLTREETPS